MTGVARWVTMIRYLNRGEFHVSLIDEGRVRRA